MITNLLHLPLMVSRFDSLAFLASNLLTALKSSHPVEVEVQNSAQISEIFDRISYNKGIQAACGVW